MLERIGQPLIAGQVGFVYVGWVGLGLAALDCRSGGVCLCRLGPARVARRREMRLPNKGLQVQEELLCKWDKGCTCQHPH